MRIVIEKKVDRDFMGGKTTVTKIVIDGTDGSDPLRLQRNATRGARRRLSAPLTSEAVEVSDAMQEAARRVFLSPSRVEALRETLVEVYRAMELVVRV